MESTAMTAQERASAWRCNWFGFWSSGAEDDLHIPMVEDYIDSSWDPPDKARIIKYLTCAPIAVSAAVDVEDCLLCSEITSISTFRSDDCWLWPDDLAHYVASHSVVLPDRFVDHIRACRYIPPEKCLSSIEELPWPPSHTE